MKKQKMKALPKFQNERDENAFWKREDSVKYVDWAQAKRVILPDLKPSTQTISLRLPQSLLMRLKLLANKRDVPYQSLLKMFLAERIERELKKAS